MVGQTFGYWFEGEVLGVRATEIDAAGGRVHYEFLSDDDDSTDWTDVESERVVVDLETTPIGSTND